MAKKRHVLSRFRGESVAFVVSYGGSQELRFCGVKFCFRKAAILVCIEALEEFAFALLVQLCRILSDDGHFLLL